jgi:hypothetical protein
MAVIQGFIGFIKGETSSKHGVNPTMIKSVAEDTILIGLVTYSTMVSARQIGLESMSLDIYNDIPIPKVVGTDQEEGFIG